jgi:hypothetical protein
MNISDSAASHVDYGVTAASSRLKAQHIGDLPAGLILVEDVQAGGGSMGIGTAHPPTSDTSTERRRPPINHQWAPCFLRGC